MSEERKPKILTRLRIDEVSAVDRGAGEGVKVVLMKRDEPASDVIAKATAALAESVGSIVGDCDDERAKALAETFAQCQDYLEKNYATDARDDGADLQDEALPVDDVIADAVGGPSGIVFDVGDTRMKFPSERSLALWLACQARINKSQEDPIMPINLSDVVKNHGIIALAKYMVEQQSSFGATEHEIVALASEDAARRYPGNTPAMAFAKLYEESAVLRDAVEIAKSAAFEDAMTAEIEKDSRAACEELSVIGKAKWPNLTPSQRFARAFETNPELARRAHRRPGPSVSHPHPTVAKDLAAPVYDPKPVFVGDDVALDVDDPREAVAQLKAQGASRWPSATALEQFERALTDPENAELVARAFARPTASTGPRQ